MFPQCDVFVPLPLWFPLLTAAAWLMARPGPGRTLTAFRVQPLSAPSAIISDCGDLLFRLAASHRRPHVKSEALTSSNPSHPVLAETYEKATCSFSKFSKFPGWQVWTRGVVVAGAASFSLSAGLKPVLSVSTPLAAKSRL